jgi:hypothetical protein
MKNLLSVGAVAAVALGGVVARATELPSYELSGFPITPHQLSVLGSSNIRERSPNPSLTIVGMPASPNQVAVLTPRRKLGKKPVTTNPVVETSLPIR